VTGVRPKASVAEGQQSLDNRNAPAREPFPLNLKGLIIHELHREYRQGGQPVNWAAAAVVLGMTTSAVADERMVLSDLALDAITASGVLVDVASVAAAVSDFGHTRTDADTLVISKEYLDLGVGITIGQALACCGEDADVEVGSAVLGIGDIVHGTTHRVKHDGRRLAYGLSVGFVVARSFENHFATVRVAHLAMLNELRAALADFHFELPDTVMVGAQ
jgi:hypothetical protein